MTKLKLVISRGSYNKLLETMDKANKDLREFTHQNIHLETQRRKRGFKRLPTDYKDIRRRADSLYDAVVAGRSWNCLCKKYHVASLRLEPRPNWFDNRHATAAPRLKFGVLLFKSHTRGEGRLSSEWRKIEVESIEIDVGISQTGGNGAILSSSQHTWSMGGTQPRYLQFS